MTTDKKEDPSVRLFMLLKARGYEVVQHTKNVGSLRLSGRVQAAKLEAWASVLVALLNFVGNNPAYKMDVSKHYFLDDGDLIYAWRLIISSSDIDECIKEFTSVVEGAALPFKEVTGFAVSGPPYPRVKGHKS